MALRGNIFLDGIAAGSGLLLATDSHATMLSGQTRWEGLESPFQFARLRTTDDEAEACQDENRLRELGTIRVQIEWVDVVRQEAWRPPSTSVNSNEPVYERSKKAGAHCTSLGELEISRRKNWYSTTRVPYIDPMEFVFQYAPLDWLRAKEIAPVPSSASTSRNQKRRREVEEPSEDSDDTVSEVLDEEEAAVYQRLRAKVANRQSTKRRRVKCEPAEGSRAVLSNPGEVIDLTGDD